MPRIYITGGGETHAPYFSIIIPVYNGLTHDLPTCLDSIWAQSLSKDLYEVICIDDCSTDSTREWLREQQKKHENLAVLENEKNIRQGGSRNRGMRAAKGKYIIFIDQDDYYHKESITQVYNHLKEHALEILIVDCAYQYPGVENNTLQHNFPHREIMTGDEQIEKNSIPYAPWKFIFLRSLVIENRLFFAENERIEDIDWVHILVHHAHIVQYQPILFIHYNKSSISTTMTAYKTPEILYSSLRVGKRLFNIRNTIFSNSNEKVKKTIIDIEERTYDLCLKRYFFFYDSIEEKSKNIRNIPINHKRKSIIVNIAKKIPKTFSAISNIVSPIGNIAMYIYRSVKYRK